MPIETIKTLGIVILLAPLLAAMLCGVFGARVLRDKTHWLTILGVGGAFVASVLLFLNVHAAPGVQLIPIYQWIASGTGASFLVQFLIDPLTAVMLVTVTGVATLVVIYSRDYMRDHGHAVKGYERFFAYLGLFVFSMCALVLGGNFLLLYLGWEAVGLCSYLLIGFYYDKPSAAAAAKKAFLVNRVGDFGFGLGILLIYLNFGTLEYHAVFQMVEKGVLATGETINPTLLTTIALLLFCGACGKSAQLPLHVWLPDAMEGPSPVSALIHAATMVTAGVYMIARCGAIFAASPTAMAVVASVGAVTALFAASIALVQMDMKRVLAYSTISQLGYMFLGVGVYAADSAVFHLFTHAYFKALLFLGAGSVMHAMGGIIDMRYFSGLRKILPWTCITFVIGSLALAGFPMLAGFFSKDEILHHALQKSVLLGGMGLLTALLTAFYTFRMVFLAFAGDEKIPEHVHAHESGGWMLLPLFVLSVGAIGAGYIGVEGTGQFHKFLAPVFQGTFAKHTAHASEHAMSFWEHYKLMFVSGGLSLVGILAAYFVYVREPWIAGLVKASATGLYRALWNKYYVDESYDAIIVRPLRSFGRFCVAVDDYVVDGLLWAITGTVRGIGHLLRGLQQGIMQSYGVSMMVGMTILVMLALYW